MSRAIEKKGDGIILGLLMREEHMSIDEAITLLNKKSGLKRVNEFRAIL